MRKMKNIFGWLGMEEEKTIIQDAEKHIAETMQTVNFFAEAINAFIQHDVAARAVAIQKVHDSEHAADELKAKMLSKINESFLAASDREDLIRFIKTLDKIADRTLACARLMSFLDDGLPNSVIAHMASASDLIVSSVKRLQDSIIALIKDDVEGALTAVKDIDYLEHEADDQKRTLIGAILAAKLDPNNLIVVYHLADDMESVTDKINTAADYIKLLSVKSRQ